MNVFYRLGQQHASISWGPNSIFKKPLVTDISKRLRKTYQYLLTIEDINDSHALACEWFLDSYHILSDSAAVIRECLVSDLYERLPHAANAPRNDIPRVLLLACKLAADSELAIEEEFLSAALSEYQQHAPLTVAEIWALPLILRLILLNECLSAMLEMLPEQPLTDDDVLPGCVHFEMEIESITARTIHALRTLNAVDWKIFFDSVSRLEAELSRDPAGVYAKMDFRTRDRYRRVIEEIAWQSGAGEIDAAHRVVDMANLAPVTDIRRRHIGYYLVDRGISEFECALAFRPRRAERMRRSIRRHATGWYLSCIVLAVSGFMSIPLWLLAHDKPSLAVWLVLATLALVPAWSLGLGLVQMLVTRIFPADLLPRIDFSHGITDDARTIVAVPAMLDSAKVTRQLVHDLEVRYLGNPDPNLSFVLLSDFVDAPKKEMPQDETLLQLAGTLIEALNLRYAKAGRDTFYLLHRERFWSEGERKWKGWERKRGKVIEFNHWLLDESQRSFKWHFGNTQELHNSRFVITLDADTMLPMGAAQSLAGIMAHPLNKAEFDPQTKHVIAGYTIVQPRIEIDPASEESSEFNRILAGDIGIDPYAHAVSDAYQDLFGTGIFTGKGIYDVASFTSSLADSIPPGRVLSHDLLEGVLGRVALASDISLYEHFPPNYVSYVRRLHRWIRGDWQLLPWLAASIPAPGGVSIPNPLSLIDRWKIIDNLRRSLFFPGLSAFLIMGWLLAPSALAAWTLLGIFAPATHLFNGIASGLIGGFRRTERLGLWTVMHNFSRTELERWILSVSLSISLAVTAIDAIARTLVRMFITHHRLLEWITFSATAARQRADTLRRSIWLEMWPSTLIAMATFLLIAIIRPAALPYSAPLLLLWIAAPELVRWLSLGPKETEPDTLDDRDQVSLRQLAFRTWHFFESFVEPNSHWLPPDNFQESPRGEVAQRTSPTNIAMMLLATLVARDLGFIGIANFVSRLRYSLDTLTHMPRHRGHILNWVDTSTLEPLEPRYVSTVDSGNLAAALITLRQACLNMEQQPYLRKAQWQGLCDLLGLLETAVVNLLEHAGLEAPECVEAVRSVRSMIKHRDRLNLGHASLVAQLRSDTCRHLDKVLLDTLRQVRGDVALADLEEIETWSNDLNEHVESMHLEVETCFPWLNLLLAPPDMEASSGAPSLERAWQALRGIAQSPARLSDTDDNRLRLRAALRHWQEQWTGDIPAQVETWVAAFDAALDNGASACSSIREELKGVAIACTREIEHPDFSFLYDELRGLFHIGYNVSENRLDSHHYDLITSEARLASFLAIARGVVPVSHWSQMSRPTVRRNGAMVLLSWTGTMFEYLMPPLLMHSNRSTLLSRGCAQAVQQQITYASKLGLPWGVSESGYYRFDLNLKYQYQAFGVPALGLKRGLGEDLVITPYASLLAICIQPQAVMDNIRHLESLGMVGRFGLYEALDFTPARMEAGCRFQIIRSYMAHHQGMILCALGNYLHPSLLMEHFHADPMVRSAEFLLNERVPLLKTEEDTQSQPGKSPKPAHLPPPPLQSWVPPGEATVPQFNVMSNGRLTTRISNYGAGDLQWSGMSLTRWRPDSTRDHWGYWVYLRDEDSRRWWPVTAGPDGDGVEAHRTVFSPYKAEFSQRRDDLFVRMEVCVAANDDVDIRRFDIQNESDQIRHLTLTSYAEIVMADPRSDEMHPAFAKLFTEARHDVDLDMLEFHRRRRSAEEQPVVLAHFGFSGNPGDRSQGYETDRGRFLGRGGDASRPASLASGHLSGTLGKTLDPILCVRVAVTLQPHATTVVNFVTGVAVSSEKVRESMARYSNDASCRWAFQEAMIESRRELAAIGQDPSMVSDVQRLLSELHYPDGALRPGSSHRSKCRVEQQALWPYGISGDDPILLLKLHDAEETKLLETLLRAHHYWRARGQHVDLVILNHEASTYANKASVQIHNVITRCQGYNWLSRHGGIFLINMDQISATEVSRLEASALAILDSGHGTLAEQLRLRDQPLHPLPRLEPVLKPVEEPPPSIHVEGLRYENSYGGFSSDGREYIIYVENEHRPPAPWSNVIANSEFGCLATESGGGYTWFLNAGEYRLTPWSNDPVSDPAGEALYLRDEQTVQVWSPLPLAGQSGGYRVHHGAGYTRYVHHSHQLDQETRVFVPPDDTVKIIQLRLRNHADHHRRLTATYYAEWVLGSQRSKTQPHIVTWQAITRLRGLFASCSWNPDFGSSVTFLTSSHVIHGFTCDRKEFLGRYGRMDTPEALQRVGLTGRNGTNMDACAALQIHLEMEPQEEITCHFVLGAAVGRKTAKRLCRKYTHASMAEDAWKRVHNYWDEVLGTITVNTPEPAMDLLLNRWLLYQTLSSRIFARTGFYQSSGAYGFRDQLQDIMALLTVNPTLAREQILKAAKQQFESGDVLHWWHPPSEKGVRTRCSDDLLWLPYVTGEYVDVTGDMDILNESIPFLSAPPLEPGEDDRFDAFKAGVESASLLEHCRRALHKGMTTGPNGLPLIGSGDWNDAMNRVGIEGRGESVWLAWFACSAARRFLRLCEAVGETQRHENIEKWIEAVQEALQQKAWDGAWYRRAFYDDGTPIGSAASTECQIDANAQSWAILSRSPAVDRAAQALESALDLLVDGEDRIVALLTPPFEDETHDPGYIKAYPPGVRENGGQYTHAAVWLAWALAQQGDGDRAEWLFQLLNPVLRCVSSAAIERYRVEPYVLAADIYTSPEYRGRGGWTWYTGSSAWLWRFGIEALLGLRRSGGELIIDPCIPRKWPGFSAQIIINGVATHLDVRNPHGLCRGVSALELGGRFITSNHVALNDAAGQQVIVHMGERTTIP